MQTAVPLAVCQFTMGQSLKIILSEMRSLEPRNILREAAAKKRHEGDQEVEKDCKEAIKGREQVK